MLNAKLVSSTRVRLMLLLRSTTSPPKGTRKTKRGGDMCPQSNPPLRRGEREDCCYNDTHDCTTAPIINGRLPLHLLRQQPSPSKRGQPYRPSAFPRLTRVVTNHQRRAPSFKTPPPFRSLRLQYFTTASSSWTLNT